MERAYYVVTDDSDKDDDVVGTCDSQTDDIIKKYSSHKSGTVSFRLLRAYRTDKHRRAKIRHQNTSVQPQLTHMVTSLPVPMPVPVSNSHYVGPEVQKRVEVEDCVMLSVNVSRKDVCLSFCKRFVAFLLSTVGLCLLTVVYSVIGGVMFAAIEAPNELRVKSGVQDSIDWHVAALWQLTTQLNVLHPVTALYNKRN